MLKVTRTDNAFDCPGLTTLDVGHLTYYIHSPEEVAGEDPKSYLVEFTGGPEITLQADSTDDAVLQVKAMALYKLTQITDALLAEPGVADIVRSQENG